MSGPGQSYWAPLDVDNERSTGRPRQSTKSWTLEESDVRVPERLQPELRTPCRLTMLRGCHTSVQAFVGLLQVWNVSDKQVINDCYLNASSHIVFQFISWIIKKIPSMKSDPLSNMDILGCSVRTGLWSLYQLMTGGGWPRTTQRKVASVSRGRVWLAGPRSMTGGGWNPEVTVSLACQLSEPAELTALQTTPKPLSLRVTSWEQSVAVYILW